MKKLFASVLVCFMLIGCAGKMPSVCDNLIDSKLCEISGKMNMRLEDVGNALIITNAIAIGEGLYTKEDALEVLHFLNDSVNEGGISYALFVELVGDAVAKYPGLFEVFQAYFNALVSAQIISPTDQQILSGWLSRQITNLERV